MARCYKISKKPGEDQANEVLRELREVPGVAVAEFTEDNAYLKVDTEEELYPEVMSRAVNICSRVAGGAELSFAYFA